jgi:hypothetical protein
MPGQWTQYQIRAAAATAGLQPVRDVVTGKLFMPQFEGQRTVLDVADAADVAREVAKRYEGDPYYTATTGDIEDYYREQSELTGVEQFATETELGFVGAERQEREVERIMERLEGGGPGNLFMRTAAGLGAWRAMQPDASGELVEVDLGVYRGGEYIDHSTVSQDQRYLRALELFGQPGANQEETIDFDFATGIDLTGLDQGLVGESGITGTGGTIDTTPAPSLGDFAATLAEIGIGKDLAEALWEWGESKLSDINYPIANILIDIYDQPAFKTRFPAIELMRGMEDVTPVTPAEYIEFETTVTGLLTRFSVGGQAVDFDGLITNLLTNNVGTGEVEERLIAANRVLGNVPEGIKQTYIKWYGKDVAKENLMKTFLDPGDEWGGSWADVAAETGSAEVGGWARTRLGLEQSTDITQAKAESINRLGLSQVDIWERLDNLKVKEALFTETLDEVVDLEIQDEGIAAAFGIDFDANEILNRRAGTRSARFRGGGGAMITGSTTGFGAANA